MAEKQTDEQDFPDIKSFAKQVSDALFSSTSKTSDTITDMEVDELSNSDQYNFNHLRRGIAVVVVNETFDGHSKRSGAELDQIKLKQCFTQLKFDVRVFTNFNGYQLMSELEKIVFEMNKDTDFDCFVFAMSSHGDKVTTNNKNIRFEEDVIHATDGYIQTSMILDLFSDESCTGLIGKPRLFFLQACRGDQFDRGTETEVQPDSFDEMDGLTSKDVVVKRPLPCRKDYIVMYATPPGFYAFRRPSRGSWFVIELCRVLSQASSEKSDIYKLLRWVTRSVAYKYESEADDKRYDSKKQSPVIYSMLVKNVLFN